MRIETVLCPVDPTTAERSPVEVAVDVCRTLGARLLVHRNRLEPSVGLARVWRWEATHRAERTASAGDAELERRLKELAARVPTELVTTVGPPAQAVPALASAMVVDLVVLALPDADAAERDVEVFHQVLDASAAVVLAVPAGARGFRLSSLADATTVLVPTDLGDASKAATALACELARALPLRLALLHVVEGEPGAAVDVDRPTIDADLPADLAGRIAAQVRHGSAPETILRYADETKPAFVVMGAHARGVLRSWLTRDTTRAVVHGVRCPIWIVPPPAR